MAFSSKLLVPVLIVVAIPACKTPATTVSSWRNPAFTDSGFEELFVIGVADNNATRRLYEDTFARVIVSQGSQAQGSWKFLPQSGELTEQEIRGATEGGDFDGVLITTLVNVDEQKEFVPSSAPPASAPAAGIGPGGAMNVRSSPSAGYARSYRRSYLATHNEGYYETNTTYRFRTELYSVATGTMVWWGESETVNPKNRANKVGSVAQAVIQNLKDEQLIQ